MLPFSLYSKTVGVLLLHRIVPYNLIELRSKGNEAQDDECRAMAAFCGLHGVRLEP